MNNSRTVSELQKSVQKLSSAAQEQALQLEEEQRLSAELREAHAASERRCGGLLAELEEARVSLEQAERARTSLESELHEAAERLGELSACGANLAAQRRKLESEVCNVFKLKKLACAFDKRENAFSVLKGNIKFHSNSTCMINFS